ncbi:MAG: hypothetical protein U0L52_08900 [Bacteroidaceae bacterium]|nr:hypothetical protein [Bacteroidaceae bacterium]
MQRTHEHLHPPSVTKIGNWAFSDCSSLTEVRIPAGGYAKMM